jgi:hypothetical protein
VNGTADRRLLRIAWIGLLVLGSGFLRGSDLYSQTSVVDGRVVDAVTGAPIARAQVDLCAEGVKMLACPVALTDAGGRYVFPKVHPGGYRLMVEARGHLRDSLGFAGKGRKLIIVSRGVTHLATLPLEPEATIRGRVVDENGNPIAGLTVTAVREGYAYGRRFLSEYYYPSDDFPVLTDKNGEYRMGEMKGGRYYLEASFGQYAAEARMSGGQSETPVYYPDVLSIEKAMPLDLSAGDHREIDLRLHPRATHTVRGRLEVPAAVSDKLNQYWGLLYGLKLEAGQFLSKWEDQYDQGTGSFTVGPVPQGEFQLSFATGIYPEDAVGCEKIDLADADVDGLVVPMYVPITVPVKVEFPSGFKPSTSYSVRLSLRADKNNCGDIGHPDGSGRVPGVDGRTDFPGVHRGRYRVDLFTEDPVYVKSARLGEQDVLANGLQIDGAVEGALEIVLARANAEVGGVVVTRDGQPVTGADVKLMAQGEDAPYVLKSVNANDAGVFVLTGVPPGEYDLVALELAVGDYGFEPADFARLKGSAAHVHVGEVSPDKVRLVVGDAMPK